ncbi:MAG: hypothetical protein WCS96_06760, partial [Victivallales bacterium]
NDVMRARLESSIARGEPNPFPTAAFDGRVSVSALGIYEGWFYRVFPPHSTQAKSNSFNAGEFIFPHSAASLLPLLICVGSLLIIAVQKALKIQNTSGKAY